MLPVWSSGTAVSLDLLWEARRLSRGAFGDGALGAAATEASDVGLLGKYSWSLALALLDKDRWKKESLREDPGPTT
ncbi:hypothetical protein GCM10023346_36850 [Arthrobacter gyeryongensis]|uniref:Uncharacterized protein n=1 Tax=Arthrobacter gyeryongensis TaxID=1650592 RepID=A0ABP9SPC1_9MICC